MLKIKEWVEVSKPQFEIASGMEAIRLRDKAKFTLHESIRTVNGEASLVAFEPDNVHVSVRMRYNYQDRRQYQINKIELKQK